MSEPTKHDVILLSRKSFWICFTISLSVFFFSGESLLENPFRIDNAIISSYLIIPALILLAHLVEKNWSLISFLIATVELTCIKFATTYLIATSLWIYAGEPPRSVQKRRVITPRTRTVKPPTKIRREDTATLLGRVVGENEQPLADVLVYVASGLEDIVFATNTSTKTIVHTGEKFEPWLTVLQTNQALIATSGDLRLHTLLDSYPVLPTNGSSSNSGRHDVIRILQSMNPKPIRCGVHSQHTKTSTSYIAVFEHPFAQQVNASGQFYFDAIPARPIRLHAWHPSFGTREFELSLKPGQKLSKNLNIVYRGEKSRMGTRN